MNYKMTAVSCMLLVIITVSCIAVPVSADNEIRVWFEGQDILFDVPPQMIDERTMVPIRAIFEEMGAKVNWNEENQTATCVKGNTTVVMTVNSPIIYINDKPLTMDVSPCVINDRTLAPARYVAESFGYNVYWYEEAKTVLIAGNEFLDKQKPVSINDYLVEYNKEDDTYKVFFGFKTKEHQYTYENGTAKINIINENGETVFSKEYQVDDSMFGDYTRLITGNTNYLLCKIEIPCYEIKKGKTKNGIFSLDFCTDLYSYGQLKTSCYDLPLLTGDELADIQYDKKFTLTEYYPSGKLWTTTQIESFEITNIEVAYDDRLKITFEAIGRVIGSEYCSFSAKCYDADGYVIGSATINQKVSENEVFKINDTFYISPNTVMLKFDNN